MADGDVRHSHVIDAFQVQNAAYILLSFGTTAADRLSNMPKIALFDPVKIMGGVGEMSLYSKSSVTHY